jgi:L-fuculose-phosphate aldolase
VLISEAREAIVLACRKLSSAGLMPGTSGNVSVRVGDLVAVTPSGLDYEEMTAESVGVHALDGAPVDALLKPTTEMPLHLAVYAATEAAAIVHTHSIAATALSTLTDGLPPIHYMVAVFGGPVPVVPYATYGTRELADNAVSGLRGSAGCILANHGSVTTGADLPTACNRAIQLEWLSEVYLRAATAGTPRLLDDGEIERVRNKLADYGQA